MFKVIFRKLRYWYACWRHPLVEVECQIHPINIYCDGKLIGTTDKMPTITQEPIIDPSWDNGPSGVVGNLREINERFSAMTGYVRPCYSKEYIAFLRRQGIKIPEGIEPE